MKVLLSGTSNSIIANGISTALTRDPRIEMFTNASYGASGTVAIGDHLRRVDFAAHDICIIDYCVNEEVFLSLGVTQLDSAVSNICNMVDAASRADCLPVILILPTYQRMGLKRPLEVALVEKFNSYGIPIFNAYDYIDTLSQKYGFQPRDLFLDINHIQRELSYFIGQEIAYFLMNVDPSSLSLKETDTYYRPLHFISHEHVIVQGQGLVVERQSRLMKKDFLSISPGSRVHINYGKPCTLSGVTLNASRSWGNLTDDATKTRVFESDHKSLFTVKRDITQVSLPMNPMLYLEGGVVSLEYTADSPGGMDRPDLKFELSGFIVTELENPQRLSILGVRGEGPRIDKFVDPAREIPVVHELFRTITRQKEMAQ